MRAITLVLLGSDRVRADGVIALAAASAALGAATHLHLDAGAIPLLRDPAIGSAIGEARALGAVLSLCPTGLADHRLEPGPFPDAERYGLITLLARLDDDARLVVV